MGWTQSSITVNHIYMTSDDWAWLAYKAFKRYFTCNLADFFSNMAVTHDGQEVGVLVSGGLEMQEDVASECRHHSFSRASSVVMHYHSVSFVLWVAVPQGHQGMVDNEGQNVRQRVFRSSSMCSTWCAAYLLNQLCLDTWSWNPGVLFFFSDHHPPWAPPTRFPLDPHVHTWVTIMYVSKHCQQLHILQLPAAWAGRLQGKNVCKSDLFWMSTIQKTKKKNEEKRVILISVPKFCVHISEPYYRKTEVSRGLTVSISHPPIEFRIWLLSIWGVSSILVPRWPSVRTLPEPASGERDKLKSNKSVTKWFHYFRIVSK